MDWNNVRVGDREVIEYVWKWRECDECGIPARFRVSFLLDNYRSNPASSGYRRNDCSWCSDYEMFACKNHKHTVEPPHGYGSAGYFPLKRFKHMGFYKMKVEDI